MIVLFATILNIGLFLFAYLSTRYELYFALFLFSYAVLFLSGIARSRNWLPYRADYNPYWPMGINGFVAMVAFLGVFEIPSQNQAIKVIIGVIVAISYLIIALKMKWFSAGFGQYLK